MKIAHFHWDYVKDFNLNLFFKSLFFENIYWCFFYVHCIYIHIDLVILRNRQTHLSDWLSTQYLKNCLNWLHRFFTIVKLMPNLPLVFWRKKLVEWKCSAASLLLSFKYVSFIKGRETETCYFLHHLLISLLDYGLGCSPLICNPSNYSEKKTNKYILLCESKLVNVSVFGWPMNSHLIIQFRGIVVMTVHSRDISLFSLNNATWPMHENSKQLVNLSCPSSRILDILDKR